MILPKQTPPASPELVNECIDYRCPLNCPLCPFYAGCYSSRIDENFRPFGIEW